MSSFAHILSFSAHDGPRQCSADTLGALVGVLPLWPREPSLEHLSQPWLSHSSNGVALRVEEEEVRTVPDVR